VRAVLATAGVLAASVMRFTTLPVTKPAAKITSAARIAFHVFTS
jgi:hypothetical protein